MLHQFWADPNLEAEVKLLADVAGLPAAHPDLTIFTWAGNSADLPAFRRAAKRHNVDPLAGRRHEDLFAWAYGNLRLPAPRLDLKTVAAAFGISRKVSIASGLEALSHYYRYAAASGPERDELKAVLMSYGADDVITLAMLAPILAVQDVPDFVLNSRGVRLDVSDRVSKEAEG